MVWKHRRTKKERRELCWILVPPRPNTRDVLSASKVTRNLHAPSALYPTLGAYVCRGLAGCHCAICAISFIPHEHCWNGIVTPSRSGSHTCHALQSHPRFQETLQSMSTLRPSQACCFLGRHRVSISPHRVPERWELCTVSASPISMMSSPPRAHVISPIQTTKAQRVPHTYTASCQAARSVGAAERSREWCQVPASFRSPTPVLSQHGAWQFSLHALSASNPDAPDGRGPGTTEPPRNWTSGVGRPLPCPIRQLGASGVVTRRRRGRNVCEAAVCVQAFVNSVAPRKPGLCAACIVQRDRCLVASCRRATRSAPTCAC
jgi:hypothetical protein